MSRSRIVIPALLALIAAMPVAAGWDEGVAAFTAKDFNTAAAEFKKLVDDNPEGYRGHYMLGAALQRLGRKDEALNHLRKAYDLNPNDLSIKMELGKAYLTVRRYGDVSKLLGSTDPGSLPASHQSAFFQMRGEAKLKSKDMEGAYKDFKSLARLQPKNSKIQYKYGAVALKADHLNDAITALGKAVSLDPKDSDKKKTYANAVIKRGRMTRDKTAKKSSYLKAAELLRDVVAKDPSYDNLLLKMSAELGAGLYDEAVQTGQKASAKNTTDWLVPFYIGQAYTSSKQFEKAEEPLRKALSLTKKPADQKTVWKQLGYAYEKTKRYSDSVTAYQNAGDQAAMTRVAENEKTARHNQDVESHNTQIKAMEEEAKRLEEELKKLEEGGGE